MKKWVFFYVCILALLGCKKLPYTETNIRETIKQASIIKIKYLALGDSYTKGQGVLLAESFPYQLVDSLHKDEFINITETRVIAQTGWTTTTLLNNIKLQQFETPYDIVTLLIGVNNQYQGSSIEYYRADFRLCLEKAIVLAGNLPRKVVVLSIPDYGFTPFGAANKIEIGQAIDNFNRVNKQITDSMGVSYIDITNISRSNNTNMVATDNLHPSGKQYKLWVDALYSLVKQKIYTR